MLVINGSTSCISDTMTVDVMTADSEMHVDHFTLEMLTIVVSLALCAVVSLFGVLSNILSIVVLTRAGFQDTVNITLLGLSVSDLGCLLAVLWRNFTMRVLVSTTDLPYFALEYMYLSGGTSLVWFTRTTSWISAYMTFKRFLCIVVPLKAKTIITKKRAVVIIVCIYVITMATVLPAYYATQMTVEFSPESNKSVLVLFFTRDRYLVNLMASPVYNVILQVASFIAVVALTGALVTELKNKRKWRKTAVMSRPAASLTDKDRKVAQMVVLIAVNFILGYIPITVCYVWASVQPVLSDLFMLVSTLAVFSIAVNSSVNILVYLKMSTRFRKAFYELFRSDTPAGNKSSDMF